MKFSVRDDSQNYAAVIVKLPVKQKVEGLDKLVKVSVFGNDCLVDKDSREDLKYIFFPAGAQLSEDFVSHNNLYREFQLNISQDPDKKGFFEPNRRVKAIKFRGITSTGFVIPITALDYLSKPLDLKVGDTFTDLEGAEICRKFVVTKTQGTPGSKEPKAIRPNDRLEAYLVPNQFRLHSETAHLGNNLHRLNRNSDIVVITDKWHGSSSILANVLIAKKLNLWQKFLNLLGAQIPAKQYGFIYSSGKPKSRLPKGIEGSWINDGPSFYTTDIWKRALDDNRDKIEQGISLYGELVGYNKDSEICIQKGYDYGCVAFSKGGTIVSTNAAGETVTKIVPPQYKMIVYRITYTKPNGEVIEFSWQQIKDYCNKYNLEHAKELFFGSLQELLEQHVPSLGNPHLTDEDHIESLFSVLQNSYNLEKKDQYCNNDVVAEGIVLRIDGKESFNAFKLKSKAFTKKESDDMDKGLENVEDGQ